MPGPDDTTRVVLDNGLVLLVRENHAAPVVAVEGYIPAGSIHDPADKAGLANFVAAMLTRGSAAYDFDAFNETIEGVGAHLGFGASDHATTISGTSLSEDFPTLLNVLVDVVRRPTFPAQQIDAGPQPKLWCGFRSATRTPKASPCSASTRRSLATTPMAGPA